MLSRPFAATGAPALTLDPHTLEDFEQTDVSPPGLFNYYNRHKTLLTLFDQEPDTAIDSFVAPSAALIGRVTIQDRSTVGYGCVLRADTNYIHVGAYSHIMDGTSVQVKLDSNGAPGGTVVGNYSTIGPDCMLSTCLIDNRAFVGAGSVIQDHSWVAEYAMLAPVRWLSMRHRRNAATLECDGLKRRARACTASDGWDALPVCCVARARSCLHFPTFHQDRSGLAIRYATSGT